MLGAAVIIVLGAGVSAAAPAPPADEPAPSTWIGTAEIGPVNETFTQADGDLWPSCWASNDNIYSAWGDGRGFDLDGQFHDVGTATITGSDPAELTGENTAVGAAVAPLWTGEGNATRKPTGMLCVGDTLYLAVQDLAVSFNEAPAATIVKSTDGGETWTHSGDGPMFDDHTFTTVWFADFGKGGEWNTTEYAYAYGLDGNWRLSSNDAVEDPVDVFLARVPLREVDDIRRWEFFKGFKKDGTTPTWAKDVEQKVPVLTDTQRVYENEFRAPGGQGYTTISQGGVLYDEPLDRYIYSSWSEWTHNFYESPTPWGPWTTMYERDYTNLYWNDSVDTSPPPEQYSGYATTLPSKFLSDDGKTMLLQANRCCSLPNQHVSYNFSTRELHIEPMRSEPLANVAGPENLATLDTAVAVSKSVRQGTLDALSDARTDRTLDDYDGEIKDSSFWGYTWPQDLTFNNVVFTTGQTAEDGGWFIVRPQVQVRQDGVWSTVHGTTWSPSFSPGGPGQSPTSYEINFPKTSGDGIRVIGVPGGNHRYTSVSEMAVHYTAGSLLDGGFENSATLQGDPWTFEGEAGHGVDTGGRLSHSGDRNVWMGTRADLGPQYVTQPVSVTPGATYDLSAWFRNSVDVKEIYLGARWEGGEQIATVPPTTPDTYIQREMEFTVPADVTEVSVLAGYDTDGTNDLILQVDDVVLNERTTDGP